MGVSKSTQPRGPYELSMLNTVKCRIQGARQALVLTGAGMSQESGLPTYRAAEDGLWDQYAMAEVATANALHTDPKKVWDWVQALALQIQTARPNAGHLALADLQKHCKVTIVTQNVDDLHERAGSTDVIHLHGSVFAYRCTACSRSIILPAGSVADWTTLRTTVRCRHCNGHVRHDVVLFNEMLDKTRIATALKAIRDSDMVLIVGTSNLIYPAAELPRYAMKRHKFVVEINPDDTPMSSCVNAHLKTLAAPTLQAIVSGTDIH